MSSILSCDKTSQTKQLHGLLLRKIGPTASIATIPSYYTVANAAACVGYFRTHVRECSSAYMNTYYIHVCMTCSRRVFRRTYNVRICAHACIYAHACECVHVDASKCVHLCAAINMCVYVCVCVCACVLMLCKEPSIKYVTLKRRRRYKKVRQFVTEEGQDYVTSHF